VGLERKGTSSVSIYVEIALAAISIYIF